MLKHSHKHTIGLAGELLRRGIMAAVTYGNAKKGDVFAINGKLAASLEVKSTSQTKWILGGELPADNSNLWVLVHLPENETESPEYFILTSAELRKLVLPKHEAYNEKYREKHGKDFSGKAVFSIQREFLNDSYLGAWGKVRVALGI